MPQMEAELKLEEAAAALRRGELVAYPTETFYGIAADPGSSVALDRLIAAKGREPDKPIALIAPDRAAAFALFSEVSPIARRLGEIFWPGPLTLVLPARSGLHPALCGEYGVGVRVSSHPVASAFTRAFGRPITATSANLAGRPPTSNAAEVRAIFGNKIKVILENDTPENNTPLHFAEASTIVALAGTTVKVLREGAIAAARLRDAFS